MAYDIFISYRRKGAGAGVAGELQSKLENLGFKVFLDVDKIGSGEFPDQIKHAIEECKDFLLVLSPGTLDRCVDEEDWVRREILMAQEFGKNIIGVGLPGFIMPEAEALPAALQFLATKQVFVWTHEYRAASFEKIAENLISSKLKKKRNRQKLFVLLPVFVAVVASAVLLLPKKSDEAVAAIEEPQQESPMGGLQNVGAQPLFDYHAKKAMSLTQNLPDTIKFKQSFLQLVSDKDSFVRLMEGIAEYDSALMLQKQPGNLIVDTYDVEAKRDIMMSIRKGYLNTIMADIKMLMDADAPADLYSQDMEIVGILDKHTLDSLEAVIKQRTQ